MTSTEAPLYQCVADRIRSLIRNGTYRPGDRLPSIRMLAQQTRVSINTARAAYDQLEAARIVEPRPQSGYFVRGMLPDIPSAGTIDLTELVPTEATTGRIAAEIHRDIAAGGIVPLGAATPSPNLLPSAALARILAREVQIHAERATSYRPPRGEPELREQIARYMVEAGCLVSPDDVIVTFGCQEAVMIALAAICKPGDTVAVESPTYFAFLQQLERLQLNAIEIPATPGDGISLEALEYAFEHEHVRACIVIPNFSNPLGSLMPDQNKRRLVALAAANRVTIIEDDIYGEIYFGEERPRALKAYDDAGEVIYCSSFSKTICPGFRIGWVVPGRHFSRIEHTKISFSVSTAAPTQAAIASFLSTGAHVRHLRSLRRSYSTHVSAMSDAVGRHFPEGTRVTRPTGGMVVWVEMPEQFDSVDLYNRARANRISIAPGPIFSVTGKYRSALRLNAGVWSAEIEAAIALLGELAHEQRRERL